MLDRYWHGAVNRISPEAPVPIVQFLKEENRLGGAGNVARNLAALGANVTLMSVTGLDEAGKIINKMLEENEINNQITVSSSQKTTVKLRITAHGQHILRVDCERMADPESGSEIYQRFSNTIQNYDVVIFSDYNKGTLKKIPEMLRIAESANKLTIVDPKGSDWTRYKFASVITPNIAELQNVIGDWSNEDDLYIRSQRLLSELNISAILLTRSADGMTLFQKGAVTNLATNAREVSDVTGAGDTVVSILGLTMACGYDLNTSMHWANYAAGLVVGKFGTSTVGYEELLRGGETLEPRYKIIE